MECFLDKPIVAVVSLWNVRRRSMHCARNKAIGSSMFGEELQYDAFTIQFEEEKQNIGRSFILWYLVLIG